MPSAYTSVVPIPQGAGNRQYRGYLEVTVQDVADSYVRVNYTAYVEMYYAWQYGVGIQVTGGGSATGVLPNAIGAEWVRVPGAVVTVTPVVTVAGPWGPVGPVGPKQQHGCSNPEHLTF